MSTALAHRPEAALAAPRHGWLDLVRNVSNGAREALMLGGTAPRFEDLVGWEFAGANSLTLTRLLGIRKFVKGFYEGPPRASAGPSPFVQGYNVDVRQNADDAEHLYPAEPNAAQPDARGAEKPRRHGFYRVHAPVPGARDARYPNAVLLDYALGGNGIFGPPLRDYLVQIYPDDPDLLLGKAYVALGPVRIPVSFFVLKRLRKHSFTG